MSDTALSLARREVAVTPSYTREQVELVKRTVAKDATDDELSLFLHVATKSGLDPFARQLYCIHRQGKMSIQTGIDGYRLVADRTGLYAGSDEPIYDTETATHPNIARVTVYKLIAGAPRPFTASARWAEYNQPNGPMWRKMPYLMLGKCAEALALRKAFPQELSGFYTHEEMQQADSALLLDQAAVDADLQTSRAADKAKHAELVAAITQAHAHAGRDGAWIARYFSKIMARYGVERADYLTISQLADMLRDVEQFYAAEHAKAKQAAAAAQVDTATGEVMDVKATPVHPDATVDYPKDGEPEDKDLWQQEEEQEESF